MEVESALAEEDGSFQLVGAGRGIKPGQYKLAVLQQNQGYGSDMLKGAFSAQNTPIEITVPEDQMGDTFDLGVVELDEYAP
jgi:hypothetical protein